MDVNFDENELKKHHAQQIIHNSYKSSLDLRVPKPPPVPLYFPSRIEYVPLRHTDRISILHLYSTH